MFDFLIEKTIVFLPLIAAIVTGFADKRLGNRNAQLLTSGAMVLAALPAGAAAETFLDDTDVAGEWR